MKREHASLGRSLSLLALAATLALPAGARSGAGEGSDLVPRETSVYVRFESVESIEAVMTNVARLLGTGSDPVDELNALVDEFPSVDPTRPVGVAWTISAASPQPSLTVLVPTSDAAAFVASMEEMGDERSTRISGSYVGVSDSASYPPTLDGFAPALSDGQVAVWVDLAAIVETYRPLIEMGIEQMQLTFSELPEDPAMPMDLEAVMDLYVDGFELLLDSVESLEFGTRFEGSRVVSQGALHLGEGSALTGFEQGPRPIGSRWLSALSPDSAVSGMLVADFGALAVLTEPMYEALLAVYPEDLRTQVASMAELYPVLYETLGDALAFEMSFDGGMRLAYFGEATDFDLWLETAQRFAEGGPDAIAGLTLQGPVRRQIGAHEVRELVFRMDEEALAQYDGTAAMEPEEREAVRREMRALLGGEDGEAIVVRLVSSGKTFAMTVGGGEAYQADVLRRALSPQAQPDPAMARAAQALGGAAPGFVGRMDWGRLFAQMAALDPAGELAGLESVPPAPITAFGGIDGATWRGGLEFDLVAWAELFRAFADF